MSEIDFDPFENIEEVIPEPKGKKKKQSTKALEKIIIKQQQPQPEKKKGDVNKKAKLIYAIQQIGKNKRFGEYLKDCGHRFDDQYLQKKNIGELEFELEKNNVALSRKSNNGMIDVVLKNGLRVGETVVSTRTKFDITGTTDTLFEDEAFLDLLERIKIKHSVPFFQMSPELEITLTIAQTMLLTYQSNKFREGIKTKIDLDKDIFSE